MAGEVKQARRSVVLFRGIGQRFRLLGIEIHHVDAALRALVRRTAVPAARLQPDISQILDPQAAPVVRRSGSDGSARARAAELVHETARLAVPVAENVRAELANVASVFPDDLLPGEDRLPELLVGRDSSKVTCTPEKRIKIKRSGPTSAEPNPRRRPVQTRLDWAPACESTNERTRRPHCSAHEVGRVCS
jgi:hypothetical protein